MVRQLQKRFANRPHRHLFVTWVFGLVWLWIMPKSGLCPGPRDFLKAWACIEVLGCRGVACNLGGSCGLWYCQTAGQNLQAIFNSHQWLKKTGQRVR